LWLWRPISLADSRIMSFRGADAGTGAMPVFLAFHRHRISLPASSSTCAKSPLRRLASLSGCTSDYRHVTITKFSLDFAIPFIILISPTNSKIQLVFTTQKKKTQKRYVVSIETRPDRTEGYECEAEMSRATRAHLFSCSSSAITPSELPIITGSLCNRLPSGSYAISIYATIIEITITGHNNGK